MPSREGVTQLLTDSRGGNKEALDELLPLVYAELHALAESYLRRERAGHTLQPTALVNEAYLRLVGQHSVSWQNRAQFFGLAARMMRRILVNYAEARAAEKRGAGATRLTLDRVASLFDEQDLDLLALHDALGRLARLDPEQARVVELRFFGGLTVEEVAEVTGVSPATVKREWSTAKLWLMRELS